MFYELESHDHDDSAGKQIFYDMIIFAFVDIYVKICRVIYTWSNLF